MKNKRTALFKFDGLPEGLSSAFYGLVRGLRMRKYKKIIFIAFSIYFTFY